MGSTFMKRASKAEKIEVSAQPSSANSRAGWQVLPWTDEAAGRNRWLLPLVRGVLRPGGP